MPDKPEAPARSAPHPRNTLNELSGEEWLYFTKSVWTTAYPSELGHALRRQHGANKPPRLMARLIEFFTKTGELVLDPFAGVGGTLLGAAIAAVRGAPSASSSIATLGRDLRAGRGREPGRARRPGSGARGPGHARPGRGPRASIRPAASSASATPWRSCPDLARPSPSTSWPPIRRTTSSCR